MSVKYRVVERGKPGDPTAPKKFYPLVKSSGQTTLRELANRIAQISTVSTVDTMAVLEALLQVIPEELADGNIVRLGDFGSFSLRSQSEGSETAEEVSAHNIKRIKVAFRPGRLYKGVLDNIIFEKE